MFFFSRLTVSFFPLLLRTGNRNAMVTAIWVAMEFSLSGPKGYAVIVDRRTLKKPQEDEMDGRGWVRFEGVAAGIRFSFISGWPRSAGTANTASRRGSGQSRADWVSSRRAPSDAHIRHNYELDDGQIEIQRGCKLHFERRRRRQKNHRAVGEREVQHLTVM